MDIISGWTVLAYLDGNGELEPEITAAHRELKAAAMNRHVKVLLEIGRLERTAVQIIRPDAKLDDNIWSGVRRYQLNAGEEILMKDLGNENMADPKCLYDFILWGLQNTYTEHVMLVLGGHACEYIGLMNDYSGKYPTVMGIPEFAIALEMAASAMGRVIDILLLDACYCNNIETLYELGHNNNNAVKILITHRGNADAGGISFRELLKSVEENTAGSKELANKICLELSSNLVARDVNTESLKQIKMLLDSIARKAVSLNICNDANLTCLLSPKGTEDNYIFSEAEEIAHIVSDITIGEKLKPQNLSKDIGILDKYIPDKGLAAFYYRLAFARDNEWTYLLCSQLHEKELKCVVIIGFSPLLIPEIKLRALVESCNPCLGPDTVNVICRKLISERGWDKRLFRNI